VTSAEQVVALVAIGRQAVRSALAVRSEVLVSAVAVLVRVVLVVLVWRAVYAGVDEVAGVDGGTAVAYAVLGAVFTNVLNPFWRSSLEMRVRPVGLVPQTLAQQVGTTAAAVPRCVLAVLLALAIGALQAPAGGVLGLLAFVVSTALGVTVALLCNLLVAMTAFWTLEVGGALMVYRAVAQFASGALIPLWFMPGWLRGALEHLPFQAQVFTPLSVYFGALRGWDAAAAVAVQALWVVLLALLAQLVWSRALHRVVVQGG
jgi:ABC-2 type transport system permease protein